MRKRNAVRGAVAAAVLLVVVAAGALAAPQATSLRRDFIGGGGRTLSSASFQLNNTVGQTASGVMSSGSYRLHTGYWYGVAAPWDRFYLPLHLKGLRV